METENKIRRVSAIAKRCVKETSEWIFALSEHGLLISGGVKALRKLKKEKQMDEFFRLSCESVYKSSDWEQKLSDLVADEDFELVARVAEIMKALFKQDVISDELMWMIDSWDALQESDVLRDTACELSGISKEDWLIDFILHIITTKNSYVEQFFVSEAKKYFESQVISDGSAGEEGVEPMDTDAESASPTMETEESFVGVSMTAQTFESLNSDGEENKNEAANHDNTSFLPSSTDTGTTSSQKAETTEELLQQVEAFETKSLGEPEGWELLNRPDEEGGEKGSIKPPRRYEIESGDHNQQPMGELRNSHTFMTMPPNNATASDHRNESRSISLSHFTPKAWSGTGTSQGLKKFNSPLQKENTGESSSTDSGSAEMESTNSHQERLEKHDSREPHIAIPQDAEASHSPKLDLDGQKVLSDENSEMGGSQIPKVNDHDEESDPKPTDEKENHDTGPISLPKRDDLSSLNVDVAGHPIDQKPSHNEESGSAEQDASIHPNEIAKNTEKSTNEGANAKGKMPIRRFPSDSSQNSDGCGSLDWFSSSMENLDQYRYNIQVLVQLTWPKEEKLLEESDWPFSLITFLEVLSKTNENLVELFISACAQVFHKAKPMDKQQFDESMVVGAGWLRTNSNLLKRCKEETIMLYQLAWPLENLESDADVTEVIKKVYEKNSMKRQRSRLKDYASAAKMVMESSSRENTSKSAPSLDIKEKGTEHDDTSKSRPSLDKEEEETKPDQISYHTTPVSQPQKDLPDKDLKNENVKKKAGAGAAKKMKEFLGFGKKGKAPANNGKHVTPESAERTATNSKHGEPEDKGHQKDEGADLKSSVTKRKVFESKQETKQFSPGQQLTSPRKQPIQQPPKDDNHEEFQDALANLEDCVVLTKPKSDDSFELRAIYRGTDPSVTTLFVMENCWYKWQNIKMQFNRERGFYHVCLPLPPKDFYLQYKYTLRIAGQNGYHFEFLPSHGGIVNREILLTKDVKYVYDVPVFDFQFQNRYGISDIIAREVDLHLPQVNSPSDGYMSYQKEIFSWVKQTRQGWYTTNSHYHCIHISPEKFDYAVMRWMIQYLADGDEMHVINRILLVLNMVVALYNVKHKIQETNLIRTIGAGLSVRDLDRAHQNKLYQLIKQEFCTTESSACPAVQQALIGYYQQLRILLSPNSPEMTWIFTLPLYWIVASGGQFQTKVSPQKKGGTILHARSALPEASQLPWSDVRSKCKNDACQRALRALSNEIFKISEIHPWIVGSFLYMVTEKSLLEMLKNADKFAIALKFPIDSVFSLVLQGWKSGALKREILDAAYSVKEFFEGRFEDILSKKKQGYSEDKRLEEKQAAQGMLKLILKVIEDFNKYSSYSGDKYRNYVFIVKMANYVSEWILQLLNVNESYDDTRSDICLIFSVICEKIARFYQMKTDEIKLINTLLTITWSDEKLQNSCVEMIKNEAKILIRKLWGRDKDDFLEFYIQSAEEHQMDQRLEECIEDYAFKCTEHLLNNMKASKSSWGWWSKPRFARLFGKLFMKEYDKVSSGENTLQGIRTCLQLIVNWKFAPRFYQEFCIEDERSSQLPEEVRRRAGIVMRDFKEEIHNFCSGFMRLIAIEYILRNKLPIIQFYSILFQKTRDGVSVDDKFSTCLSMRKGQLQAIRASRRNLTSFLSLCSELEDADIKVNVKGLENLSIMKDDTLLNKILAPDTRPQTPERGLNGFQGVSSAIANELNIINALYDSKTFQKVWKNVLDMEEEVEERELEWKHVLDEIWPIAKKRTFSVFGNICDGSIAVSVLVELFYFSEGNKSKISSELQCLGAARSLGGEANLDDILLERVKQIENVLQLKKSEKASRMILALKSVLNLSGDFKCLEIIESMEDNEDLPLKDVNFNIDHSFSDELWSDAKFVGLLEKFVDQSELIQWLRNEMKDLKEVQTFCDLGMISAGETQYEVDRVSFLLRAVMGFSPLIFDLSSDAGLNDVMNKCMIVRKNVESDSKLIEKWTDTARQLSWFEGIHKFHGSVGTQSLTLAQDINSRGIYLIEKPAGETPTIENSLKLVLQPVETRKEPLELETLEESSEKGRSLEKLVSYNGLKDLQSKLMLIAGEAEQGHQDVARFNDVLSAVANLTQGYINLYNAGCMLFYDWSGKIVCSKEEVLIYLNFSDDTQPVSTSASLKDLELLVGVMNGSLVQWSNYIDKMRLKHYYLNDYNIQQIMYLCEKLAKSDFTDQVYSLLSGLRQIQLCDHMQNALDEATEIQEDEEIVLDESPSTGTDGQVSHLELKNRMVRELVKNGLSEYVAKAAVQCEENKDIDDCENWALLHEYEEDLITELAEEYDEEAGFGPETDRVQNYTSLLHNRTALTLKELITRIQEETDSELKIHSIVKTICSTYNDKTSKLTLQDSLSINHLGKFLTILREKLGKFSGRVVRKLQAPMQPGKANLVLIPTGDMLYTTLSLYMENQDQPLPTKSEVLICTENTTEDEVGHFLHRAMCHNPRDEKGLFCMVFAEKLTFSVSAYVERAHNELSSKENFDNCYQMVIFCSNASQQHYLVTCFDRTKVELKLATDMQKLSNYLVHKLKAEHSTEPSVKLVSSKRSGVGKSLYVKRLIEKLEGDAHVSTLRLLEKQINVDHVLNRLYRKKNVLNEDSHLVHLDLTSAVQNGIEEFAFNLFVLGSIQDSQGQIWRRYSQHMYVVEMVESRMLLGNGILNLIPSIKCLSPRDVLEKYDSRTGDGNQILMDRQEFESDTFQRPYQYLKKYDAGSDLDKFRYTQPEGKEEECIKILLKHCGMKNPSWAQLKYFSSFLNMQLINCEESIFCQTIQSTGRRQDAIEFAGLKAFAVYFMMKMAQDFATPSLHISDESARDEKDAMEQYAIRRRWEDEIHPFVFFNEDRTTMTFINVNVDSNGNLLKSDGSVSQRGFISKRLLDDLKRQGVPFGVKFNTLPREDKIRILCQFMNIPREFDPDRTYELTTDNVLKMLAIYMRLRCQIPVIVMGETGCGKTRMIEFMSKMRSGHKANVKNMVTLKIHGGIKVSDIYQSVRDAKAIAKENNEKSGSTTILFYDEANTTSAIYAIKEVVCDFSIDGEDFRNSQLQIVAACNPYKKLSEKAVKKLEESGLGYNIRASEAEQVGHIPMRRLVYRVVPLPPSMQPFVWDFGQLGDEAEEIYIKQMTDHLKEELKLSEQDATLLHSVLCKAQCYMRQECRDESRYVSLRDVERSLKAFRWFYEHSRHIFCDVIELHKEKQREDLANLPEVLRCLLHTVSVCYHASLDNRKSFRQLLSAVLSRHSISLSERDINTEIVACQTVFTESLKMDDNIACNEALRENVFLMTVCTDLRIPLFVVGKPGSSKSLAKTIVGDNMQGKTSHSDLYKNFKQVHILSYQCSALTDAEGIESIFNQCAQLQSNQDIDSYCAVVVLDEIGLAEDSPNMPLKVLHPLLECGSTKNGTLTEFDPKRKVAFVGISNWALDPAKMNRGIFVTRSSPSKKDLETTAKGIFENQKNRMRVHKKTIKALTDGYLKLYEKQEKEYFGLRDYYSLIKMLHEILKTSQTMKQGDVENALQRNFSGGAQSCLDIFKEELGYLNPIKQNSVQSMVMQNLEDDKSRFLLLLTTQYSAFSLLQNFIPEFHSKVQVIFGSSFPNDHSYTEMCRNINRVKVCMETGQTVILLNMTEINESLYDALNQHYVTLGGQRYVDLGLGGHRVKCRIGDGFRLIVIELKDKVYNEYPIPLINRLEKHHLTSKSLLAGNQQTIAEDLGRWVQKFSTIPGCKFTPAHAFLGFNEDSASSVVISYKQNLRESKNIILKSATMDSVFRLPRAGLGSECSGILSTYVEEQTHDNLWKLIKQRLEDAKGCSNQGHMLLEITTFSNILSDADRKDLEFRLMGQGGSRSVMLISLQQFQTEQDYLKKLDDFINFCNKEPDKGNESNIAVLLVQCPQAHRHTQLVACARYGLKNKLNQLSRSKKQVFIGLLLSTERKFTSDKKGGEEGVLSLQHSPDCEIVYVDELRPSYHSFGQTSQFHGKTICEVLTIGQNSIQPKKEGDELGVHMPTLLKDCVCEAMAKVKSKAKNDQRNLECVQILCRVFSDDVEINYHFLNVLMEKMVEVYKERENEMDHTNWVVKEACSAEKLQEGGTFAKTLWLCLKSHVSLLLAYIVSLIDEENNLNIIADTSENCKRVHNMWMEMFHACRVKWDDMRGHKEFEISSKPNNIDNGQLRIPFFFLIHRTLEEEWLILKDVHGTEKRIMFFNLFGSLNPNMSHAVGNALKLPRHMDLVVAFARNLIKINYSLKGDSISKLSDALVEIATKLFHTLRQEKQTFPESHWFLILFYCAKEYQNHLFVLNEVLNLYPESIDKVDAWIKEMKRENSVMIHKKGLDCALQHAKRKALVIKDSKSCCDWIYFTRHLRTIFQLTLHMLDREKETSHVEELLKSWEPLSLLDHLLLHLLPNPKTNEEAFKKYVEVIASHAKLLYKGLSKSGVRGQPILRIVCNVLRKYYEDVYLKVLLSWQNTTCRTCRKTCKQPTILPCGHFFCCSCLKNTLVSLQDQKKCPSCSTILPDSFSPVPTELTDAQSHEVHKFKAHCTSFFLEYLSEFVFCSGNSETKEDVIQLIIDELILERETEGKPELEKIGLSLNAATKTSMLTILFVYDRRFVESCFNRCLVERSMSERLAPLIIKHFEQLSASDDKSLETSAEELQEFISLIGNGKAVTSVESLEVIAKTRLALSNFAKAITEKYDSEDDEVDVAEKRTHLYDIKRLISSDGSETLKKYLVKVGCKMNGMEWFSSILQSSSHKELIPHALQNAEKMSKIDYYTSLGQSYSEMRSNINKTAFASLKERVNEWFPPNDDSSKSEMFKKILALASWLHSHNTYEGTFAEHFQTTSPENVQLCDSLLSIIGDSKRWVQEANGLSNQQKSKLEQLIPLVCGVIRSQPAMMTELHDLMADPIKVRLLYWPAMPESFFFSIPQELRCEGGQDAMYQCPNGHFYTIGQCTKPWTLSRCPDCRAVIGGRGHVAESGNERVKKMEESSQAGYMLLSSGKNLQSPEDRISMQATSVIQMLIHVSMLIGIKKNPAASSQILPGLNTSSPSEHLLHAMIKNLENLAKSVGRNNDETILLVHSIMLNILKTEVGQNSAAMKASWKSIACRKEWERHFRSTFLLPVFRNINNVMNTAQQNLNAAEDMRAIALFRLVHEVREEVQELPSDAKWWQNPCYWHIIQHSNAAHLLQCVRDNSGSETGTILQAIFDSADLELLHYLGDVLSLQKRMVEKYQNKIDLGEAENKTIAEFLIEAPEFERETKKYLQAWHDLRHKLQGSGECDDQMTNWFDEEISLKSPMSFVLPSARGRGRCAKLLAEYLVEIQNRFLLKCFEIAAINASENEVDAPQLSSSHIVQINKQVDLLPLISLHTSCVITEDGYGRHHHISYNIDALEKQALKSFVRDKKLIVTESLPRIKYTQDVGIGTDWNKVIEHTRLQEPLTTKLKQTLDDAVATATPAEVCEGVRTLTYAISFLAKVESEHSGLLHEYLERDLLLVKSRTAIIPRFARVHHTLGLYQRLTWHRSVNFVQQGLHPYQEALHQVNQEEITDQKLLKDIKNAFEHMDVVSFQQHLNEMLIKIPDYAENWSLTDLIFPNLLFIGNEATDDTWFDGIPSEICFKHVSHLFKLAVEHVQSVP